MTKVFTQLRTIEDMIGRTVKNCVISTKLAYEDESEHLLIIFEDDTLINLCASGRNSWGDYPEVDIEPVHLDWKSFGDEELVKVGFFTKEEMIRERLILSEAARINGLKNKEKQERACYERARDTYFKLIEKYGVEDEQKKLND